jgi:hypothetical protein
MATVVHWAKAHDGWPMVVAFGSPCHLVHGQSAARAHSTRGNRVVHGQRTQHRVVLNGAAVAYRRRGLHLDLLHGSLYELRQQDQDKVVGRGVLTGEAVGAATADGVCHAPKFQILECD